MRPILLATLFLVLCGASAGWLVADLVPPAPRADEIGLWTEDYRLVRKPEEAFEVTDGHWLRVPRLFADFDLQMDVELGEHTELDLLLRQVEPRIVQGQLLPFHGRFAVLRMSTEREGQAWLSREEALLGAHGSGAVLAPGYGATVWVEGRGRELRANVAGKWLPWFRADDEYGMFSLVARGGRAVVQRLVIENRGWPHGWMWSRWWWVLFGAMGAALVAAAAKARNAGWAPVALLGPLLLSFVWYWLASRPGLEPLRWPPPAALASLLGGSCVFLAGVVLASGWRKDWRTVAFLIGLTLLQASALDLAQAGLVAGRTPAIDAIFGPRAGSSLSEAHAQLVRGPFALHGPGVDGPRVFLLGGQHLYGRFLPPEQHLEPMLRGELRGALRRPVEVVGLPTEDGHTQQQWAMFRHFYAEGHRPHVIVFGVGREEAEPDEATGAPRSYPSTLERTLREARTFAVANGSSLVVFTEDGLPPAMLAVLQQAERDGLPLVVAAEGESTGAMAKKLAAAILPRLR